MKKNSLYYFKRAFLLSVPITVFVIVRDLFEIELTDMSEIINTVLKGVAVGLVTGIILGILNLLAKIEIFVKNK